MEQTVKPVKTIEEATPTYGVPVLLFLNFIVGLIQLSLGLRFIFKLLAANSNQLIVSWLYALTTPLVDPFRGMFGLLPSTSGLVEWSTLVAMIAYAVVSYIVIELVTILLASISARSASE